MCKLQTLHSIASLWPVGLPGIEEGVCAIQGVDECQCMWETQRAQGQAPTLSVAARMVSTQVVAAWDDCMCSG